jgi:hypothetical protein
VCGAMRQPARIPAFLLLAIGSLPPSLTAVQGDDSSSATLRAQAGQSAYTILWSSGSTLSDAELLAAGTVPHMVENWSPHDTPAPHSVACSPATPHVPCILSLFPLIQKAPLPNLNGGVPQAANLSAHLDLLRNTLPSGIPANYTGVAAIDFENWTPIWCVHGKAC